MRDWHGPISDLHDAVMAQRMLFAFCLACGHASRFDPRSMAHRFGKMRLDVLARRFRCSRCKSRAAHIVPALLTFNGRNA